MSQADTELLQSGLSPYQATSAAIVPGAPVAAGRGVLINATAAGTQMLKLSSGSTLPVLVNQGSTWIDRLAVVDAPSAGTTAVASVYVLN